MKKHLMLAGASAFSILAAGAQAAPAALSLDQMEEVTAGNAGDTIASGGAIVGNDSAAAITSSGEVEISDGVQAGARALNLVNASESTVANGVNVFDGNIEQSADFGQGTQFNVTQRNQISQEQRRVASAPFYERADANVDRSTTDSGTSNAALSLSKVKDITDVTSSSLSKSNTSEGSIEALSTLLGQNVQAGRGISGAGELDVHFDGGSVDFNVAGGVSLGGEDSPQLNGSVGLKIELPEFTIAMQGAGCAVQNGSCSASGTFAETQEELQDRSTFHSLDRSESSSAEWDRTLDETIRAPFTLTDAQAEYIVVDDSEVTVQSAYRVALSGGTQANLEAMNVVNAAGSAVANGVNVARQNSANLAVAGGAPIVNLVQTNIINHSR